MTTKSPPATLGFQSGVNVSTTGKLKNLYAIERSKYEYAQIVTKPTY
jgi:hypothetical protein